MENDADVLAGRKADLERIGKTLRAVALMVECTDLGGVEVRHLPGGDPVTQLDHDINELIRSTLVCPGEGWLSEETRDDMRRLNCERVWIIDPIDGTREFVEGVPEWSVSIGLVEASHAAAGGILNPRTGEMFLGCAEFGVQLHQLGSIVASPQLDQCTDVLVSRKEHREGRWKDFENAATIVPVGSIAYRLARVATGYACATGTFNPRNEWDVAAGVALVNAAGGTVQTMNGSPIRFNRPVPEIDSFIAFAKQCPANVFSAFGFTAAA